MTNNPLSMTDPTGMIGCSYVTSQGATHYGTVSGMNSILVVTNVVTGGGCSWAWFDLGQLEALGQGPHPPEIGLRVTNFGVSDTPIILQPPQAPTNNKPGFWSCTFSAGTGTALGTTALDAIGIIPGGGNVLHGVQLAAGVGALGLSLGGASFSEAAVGGATTGLAFADAAGETANIAVHGVEIIPVLGNFVSAVATANDIFGKKGVIASYKACFSGGH